MLIEAATSNDELKPRDFATRSYVCVELIPSSYVFRNSIVPSKTEYFFPENAAAASVVSLTRALGALANPGPATTRVSSGRPPSKVNEGTNSVTRYQRRASETGLSKYPAFVDISAPHRQTSAGTSVSEVSTTALSYLSVAAPPNVAMRPLCQIHARTSPTVEHSRMTIAVALHDARHGIHETGTTAGIGVLIDKQLHAPENSSRVARPQRNTKQPPPRQLPRQPRRR
jgi:hypothetical protein